MVKYQEIIELCKILSVVNKVFAWTLHNCSKSVLNKILLTDDWEHLLDDSLYDSWHTFCSMCYC
jgi:hypothetical protein